MIGFPKPEKRSTVNGRNKRAEASRIQTIRALCVVRDGVCRVGKDTFITQFGGCWGFSEWAHFGAYKRARTRGQAPLDRHTTAGSLMLCQVHHGDYDAGLIFITATDPEKGCDGALSYRMGAR